EVLQHGLDLQRGERGGEINTGETTTARTDPEQGPCRRKGERSRHRLSGRVFRDSTPARGAPVTSARGDDSREGALERDDLPDDLEGLVFRVDRREARVLRLQEPPARLRLL